jgi:chemotaxis methyl-accepting protein methylase
MKPLTSALIVVACQISKPEHRQRVFRELVSLGQQVRRKLASIRAPRSARDLARVRNELGRRPVSKNRYAEIFAARTDPWRYERAPSEFEKFQTTIELLDGARNGARFARAWEIGCGEGAMTARLAAICGRLLAVDFIPLALERASARCQDFSNISFTKWDLKADPAPATFDLIVITDVLGSLGGQRDICRARDKLVNALAPGGYLLYGDYIGDSTSRRINDSWWGRLLLLRPRKILRLIAAHPALAEVARRETTRHLLVLFRNSMNISIRGSEHGRGPRRGDHHDTRLFIPLSYCTNRAS